MPFVDRVTFSELINFLKPHLYSGVNNSPHWIVAGVKWDNFFELHKESIIWVFHKVNKWNLPPTLSVTDVEIRKFKLIEVQCFQIWACLASLNYKNA